MTLEEAKALLSSADRDSLWDGTFGDEELYWEKDGEEIAIGYFSRTERSISVGNTTFDGADADALRYCGKTSKGARNDEGCELR